MKQNIRRIHRRTVDRQQIISRRKQAHRCEEQFTFVGCLASKFGVAMPREVAALDGTAGRMRVEALPSVDSEAILDAFISNWICST